MFNLIITIGSVTTAARINKKIKSLSNIKSSVIHTPSAISQGGCSYSIRTNFANLNLIRKMAEENKITYKKLFTETKINGELEYNDIS